MAAKPKKLWRGGKWQRPFFTIWGGQAFSLIGSSLVGFSLVWWLTIETGSATVLALGTLFQILPQVVVGPFAGTLVDRWNRRTVMLVADSLVAIATLLLAALFFFEVVQIWHVIVILMLRAIGGVFHWPAMQSSTSLMVPEEQLARVAGLNQTLQGLRGIVSPPLAAFLLAIIPLQAILMIDVFTALLAVLPLLFIDIPQPERTQNEQQKTEAVEPSMMREMAEGFRYVLSWPGLMALILMAVVLNLLYSPAFSLMPLLVKDYFGGDAAQLGIMEAGWGLGMLLGGLTLSIWGGFKRKAITSLTALVFQSAGVLILGFASPSAFYLGALGMLLAGFMNPIVNGPIFAIMQSTVDADMQGRVFSLLSAGTSAMTPLGLLVIGPIADKVGVHVPFMVTGIVSMIIAIAAFFIKPLVNIEDQMQQKQPADDAPPQSIEVTQIREVAAD